MSTITSANSQLTISAPDVFGGPQAIEGYATDDAFSVPQFEVARAVMGVDGRMSAGFIPAVKELDIVLQADSPSLAIFEEILGVMESTREVVFLSAVIVLPSVGKVFNFTRGVLTKTVKLPPAKKTLEPVSYQITWQDIQPAPI